MQKVLKYKQDMQNNESNVLREMKYQYAVLQNELDCLIQRYDDYKCEFLSKCQAGLPIKELIKGNLYLKSFMEQINIKRQQIKNQLELIDRQIKILLQIKIQKTSIEKLREKKLEAYNMDALKAQENYIEEFVSNANLQEN